MDYRDTELKMTEKLQNQVNNTEWSWKNLNTVFFFNILRKKFLFSYVGQLVQLVAQCMKMMKKDS